VADRETTRLSKFLSLVLRHQPEVIGVALDAAGWVPVDELLAACRAHGTPIDRALLLELVATSPKQRFALSEDGARIRASQGHSVEVELGYQPAEPPETLFHGTVAASLDAIREGGLRRMERHHVHLSPDADTARAVGARRGAPVVLRVAAGAMHRAGHLFYRSANGVWLTEHVPPDFIELPPAPAPGSGAAPR
jgi:putative RNA 2'-phosphotransferase